MLVSPALQQTFKLCMLNRFSVHSVSAQKLVFRHNLYKMREEREMSPKTMLSAICNLLYEKR